MFFFSKNYSLFNGFIFLTIKKFLLTYFSNFHCQRSGREAKSWYFIPEAELFQSCRGFGQKPDVS